MKEGSIKGANLIMDYFWIYLHVTWSIMLAWHPFLHLTEESENDKKTFEWKENTFLKKIYPTPVETNLT